MLAALPEPPVEHPAQARADPRQFPRAPAKQPSLVGVTCLLLPLTGPSSSAEHALQPLVQAVPEPVLRPFKQRFPRLWSRRRGLSQIPRSFPRRQSIFR
jgi:hypothetical protein